ncbi:MAG: hypothetical protein KTR32_00310 [Granulosicoccus sp.]|nr:hypothetical protein [Granulosicoccus sp.]
MKNNVSSRSTINKALRLNLDEKKYGTIAEIGAGQEVARQFFLAGAAAGTVAKTMSAYDMQFSDAIYGTQTGGRYVSKARVIAMLDKEYSLVLARLSGYRPRASRYFSYAATVSAKSFNRNNECHAWCGIRLQMYPGAEPSDVIVHVRMLEGTADLQQQTLGILGVNLIYGAYYFFEEPRKLIDSLTDNLEYGLVEIDSIDFGGPYFEDLDNRATNLHLIRSAKAHAIMFTSDGEVAVPSELLYKKNVLTTRGSFKPVTRLNADMIDQGFSAFKELDGVSDDNTVVLAEISLKDSHGKDLKVPEDDLICRVELLNALGYSVMVSDYTRYFSLRSYFRQFTSMQIGIVLGMINMKEIFDDNKYIGVEGGILEGFGKLFPDNTRLFVYPELDESGQIRDFTAIEVPENMKYLYQHLLHNQYIFGINCGDPELLKIYSRNVLDQLTQGRGDWEHALADDTAARIIDQQFFGYSELRKAS